MGYPKQPGQDAKAHQELAERHLAVLNELSALRAENARLREALEYVSQALLSIRENGVFQYLPEDDGIATGAIETARAALGGRDA